ncbi:hypothetical protein ABZT04_38360 [Streptomyces sp. NPDC005492]|uniref:hypothetical protein n=1 Tax=Streptomyces sp. NPDC005492 TaxID=3156883 RepID=UPI0033B1F753
MKSRNHIFRLLATFSATIALAFASLAWAGPASAASQNFENAGLRDGYKLVCCSSDKANPVWLEQFANASWSVYHRGDTNGHSIVQMQSADRPAAGCLDSHGNSAGGQVWVQACNSGDYQLWEVFHVSDSSQSYVVFKSRGAYTKQGKHLCIAGLKNGGIREGIVLKTCNVNDVWQRFF